MGLCPENLLLTAASGLCGEGERDGKGKGIPAIAASLDNQLVAWRGIGNEGNAAALLARAGGRTKLRPFAPRQKNHHRAT